jgi:hypothetical protein
LWERSFRANLTLASAELNDDLVLFIVIDGVINYEILNVSLYPIGCGENEVHIERKVYVCTEVQIQKNRIRKHFRSTNS